MGCPQTCSFLPVMSASNYSTLFFSFEYIFIISAHLLIAINAPQSERNRPRCLAATIRRMIHLGTGGQMTIIAHLNQTSPSKPQQVKVMRSLRFLHRLITYPAVRPLHGETMAIRNLKVARSVMIATWVEVVEAEIVEAGVIVVVEGHNIPARPFPTDHFSR